MITLSRADSLTKSAIKWTAVIIISILLITFLFRIGTAIKERFLPTPLPPPTVAFGKLSAIDFPQNTTNDRQLNFSLNTLTGTLPSFSDRAKVYKIVPNKPDLLALTKTQQKVSGIGFTSSPTHLSGDVYQWTDSDPIARKIKFNIYSLDFNLSSSFLTNQVIYSGTNLPDQNQAIGIAQSFLSSMSSFPQDIDPVKTKAVLFSINNYSLVPATSIGNAQIIRVDFFQKDMDKMPIYYPDATKSNMSVFVGGGEREAQVVKVDFIYQSISNEFSTYPIKTADETFSELKENKAYIASYGDNPNNRNIAINDVSLGYYIGESKEDYLMPIVVFKGTNGFVAYVSAVKDEWINN